ESHAEKQELRFQAKGAQTVLPPSRHPSGTRYAWKPGHGPGEIEPAIAPAWLLAELQALTHRSNGRARRLSDGERILEGRRDSTLTSLAGSMRRRGMGAKAIEEALLAENEERCHPPLAQEQVQKIAQSVS